MPAHKHAHLMMEYAKDALETNKPWERWEILYNGKFINQSCHPTWLEEYEYRRKPRTININWHEVPEPVKCPICFEDEPHTGTCGSNDPKALCNRPDPVKRKRRYAQGTALGEYGVIPMCDQVDDEPACPECGVDGAGGDHEDYCERKREVN